MREYKITKSDLWYHVYRIKEEDWIIKMERLQRNSYTLYKDFARTFYKLDDAIGALVGERIKWKKETPTTSTKKSESGENKEKTSWSEL